MTHDRLPFMRSHTGMRPQDILVLLKMVVWGSADTRYVLRLVPTPSGLKRAKEGWRQLDLAHELGLSQGEVTESLNRSRIARLVDADKRQPMRKALLDFLLHGVQYVFPALPGAIVRGMPTAHSAPPLSNTIVDSEEKFVWPDEEGEVRGQAIAPLYPTVPAATRRDPRLYELLTLVDALRVGRAREQKLAREELERRLMEPKS